MKRVKNKRKAWVVLLALFPVFSIAQNMTTGNTGAAKISKHEFSVQQAVDYARKNNVQVKNALLGVQIQEQTNREVTSAALPQVSASGSYTYNAKLPVSLVPAEFLADKPELIKKLLLD